MKRNIARALATTVIGVLVAAGCGSDNGAGSQPDASVAEAVDNAPDDATRDSAPGDAAGDDDAAVVDDAAGAPSAPVGGGSGTVVLDGETIVFDQVLCHLESQPAAAGGGNILFVVQGYGVDATNEPVILDVSRFDDDSMFAGDDVQLYIGEITAAGDARELGATPPAGTVTLDGSTVSVDGLTLEDFAALTEHTVSFTIHC